MRPTAPPLSSPPVTNRVHEPPSTILSPRRVLVVDDDMDLCEVLVKLLTDEGYEVSSARDGQHALSKLLTQTQDVVLLDLMMPVMSGRELLDLRPWFPSLKSPATIVMSAEVDQSLDVAAVIAKPFLLEDMLTTVRSVSSRRE